VEALGSAEPADAKAVCRSVLAPAAGEAPEASYGVRAAAIDVLAELKDADALETVRAQVAVPSHNDAIAIAAVRCLAKLGDAKDVPALQGRAALGIADRARPDAVDALAELAKRLDAEGRSSVERFLAGLLEDPEDRTAMSAGGALAELRCKDALPRLRAMAEHDRDPGRRRRAKSWVKEIEGPETAKEGPG
jgi:HEAT repeat protein